MHAMPNLPGLSPVRGQVAHSHVRCGPPIVGRGLDRVARDRTTALLGRMPITGSLRDLRDPTRIRHSYADMARARMLMIAAGYEDCDDVDTLRSDPALEDRGRSSPGDRDRPDEPADAVAAGEPRRLACARPHRPRLRSISTAGASGDRRRASCSISMTRTIPCTASRSWRCSTRTTTAPASSRSTSSTASRASRSSRSCAPASGRPARRSRRSCATSSAASAATGPASTSWFAATVTTAASPRSRCWSASAATYIIGFAINSKLLEIAAPWREQCDWRRSQFKPTVRRFHQLPYRAREWSRSRKLVARVEATALGTDVRFIVTSLEGRGKTLYEKVFCARGNAENLIKDMKRFTRSDKTACSRWQANQFRLFLHVGAYWLLHSLRQAAPKRSRWRGATFETIRRAFVKVAVRVEELKGRIKLAFPASYPQAAMLAMMTGAITKAGP